ncbi:MAG: ABC transporter ATP-binding protein [Lachnospiraceae bacterium]|nr:ABC transporter ATP-binding protein [Lachnospiraceae bacterium]
MKKNPIGAYILRNWYLYLIAMAAMIISITLDMCGPMVTRNIIDKVIVGGKMELLSGLLLSLLGIGLGRAVFQYAKEFIFDAASVNIASDMRGNLFRHIQRLSIRYFDKNNTGELMARVKDDVDKVWNSIGFVGMLIIEGVIHIICVLTCMLRISPVLTLIPLAVMPLVGYVAVKLENKLSEVYDDISEQNAELNTVAQENLAGVRTVKAFAREDYEIDKFARHNKKYYDLNMRQAKLLIKYDPNISMLAKLMHLMVIVAGGVLVIREQISLGDLGAFSEYANNIIWPIEIMGWLSNDFASALASNKKINKILTEEPEIREEEKPVRLEKIEGRLEFEHVGFKLDDTQILSDISFVLEPGKTIGIMGMTGSGKTSIVNLTERFYDVTEGRVTLDGVDVRKLPISDVRKSTSVVMQDVFLFSDTITDNVSLGNRDSMKQDTIKEAVRLASAQDFIERMSEQYDTIIGERGVGLSGGQKQRISIARALAKNAPILILDDSTSALDMETEHEIWKELSAKRDVAKMIIAHRISAVRNADEIIILENGSIAERGTHEELLQKKGLYYKTYEAQYGML